MLDATTPADPAAAETASDAGVTLPRHYTLDESGLLYWPTPVKDRVPPPIQIAGPFEIVAETSDESGTSWGLLLRWRDRDGRAHQWAMPRRMVHADGNSIAAELSDAGLTCGTSARAHDLLKDFLGGVVARQRTRCVTRAGWHTMQDGSVFVLPDGSCFTPEGAGLGPVLQSESAVALSAFAEASTLDDWQREVAAYAAGNDRLALFLAAAFAGPLLDIISGQSGGVNLVGKSQSGKTTALRVAASAWGRGDENGQIRTWRATANGLEGTAAESTDTLLCLDELSQADAREVAETVYLLANQAGKSRADRTGRARRRQTWRVIFLSTGEITLAAKLGEVGRRPMAGQAVRMLDLPADAGAGRGVFQNLHDKPSAAALADHLRDATRRHYGAAGRAFLADLVATRAADAAGLRSWLDRRMAAFLAAHLPDGADGQVRSAAARFALIAAAGELATHWRVLPWPDDEAGRAAGACFAAWLAGRGGAGAAEDAQAIESVRAFISAHGAARFAAILPGSDGASPVDERVNNRAGWRRWTGEAYEYLILPSVWTGEVCRGVDARRAADALRVSGFLLGGDARHRAETVTIPGHGKLRLYRVAGSILGAED